MKRNNVFDSLGNYPFCSKCIINTLHISKARLTRQRSVKQKQSSEPTTEMKKSDVENQHLKEHVVMPDHCSDAFSMWWKSLSSDCAVKVRFPHAQHGLQGKPSNNSKVSTREDSQLNGRCTDSFGPTFYFLPKL